jgi:hypothetical protein
MEKLVKKFEKINGRMLSQHGNAISSAEETQRLAIEYKWWSVTQSARLFDVKELPEGMDIEDFLKIKEREQFNRFVEEYYK